MPSRRRDPRAHGRGARAAAPRPEGWLRLTPLGHLAFAAGAAALGFALPVLFSGWLGLPRTSYLAPYVAAVAGFLAAYARAAGLDLRAEWRRRPAAGLAGALVAGAVMVWHVASQPGSPRPEGLRLAAALAWLGVAYGAADALLLTVMPVVAAREAASRAGRSAGIGAAGGLLASAAVTAAYHLGYPEFRGAAVAGPVLGNTLLTAGYLATGSPVAPVGAHVLMHLAAVLHGIDSTVQLPPHE